VDTPEKSHSFGHVPLSEKIKLAPDHLHVLLGLFFLIENLLEGLDHLLRFGILFLLAILGNEEFLLL
jgi:hypothetical protein